MTRIASHEAGSPATRPRRPWLRGLPALAYALGVAAEDLPDVARAQALLLAHAREHGQHDRRQHRHELGGVVRAQAGGLAEALAGLGLACSEDLTEQAAAALRGAQHAAEQVAQAAAGTAAIAAAQHRAEHAADVEAGMGVERAVQELRALIGLAVARERADQERQGVLDRPLRLLRRDAETLRHRVDVFGTQFVQYRIDEAHGLPQGTGR